MFKHDYLGKGPRNLGANREGRAAGVGGTAAPQALLGHCGVNQAQALLDLLRWGWEGAEIAQKTVQRLFSCFNVGVWLSCRECCSRISRWD